LALSLPTNTTIHPPKIGKRCTGNIQSLSDVAAAQECTTIVIGGFTVPAGREFHTFLFQQNI
jgi:galacturan 1,4-alpha-galacturonidase